MLVHFNATRFWASLSLWVVWTSLTTYFSQLPVQLSCSVVLCRKRSALASGTAIWCLSLSASLSPWVDGWSLGTRTRCLTEGQGPWLALPHSGCKNVGIIDAEISIWNEMLGDNISTVNSSEQPPSLTTFTTQQAKAPKLWLWRTHEKTVNVSFASVAQQAHPHRTYWFLQKFVRNKQRLFLVVWDSRPIYTFPDIVAFIFVQTSIDLNRSNLSWSIHSSPSTINHNSNH